MTTYRITHERANWLNIVHPTPEDVDLLRQSSPYIHPLNLEDILSPMERPKIDEDERYLFVVLHFPLWDPVQRLTRPREVDFVLGRGYVATIHDGSLKPLQRMYQQCETDEDLRKRLLGRGANHAFYTIIDNLIDYIFPILRKVDSNINDIEEGIFTANSRQIIREITLVRRDVIALRRIIRMQVPVLESLEQTEHPIIHEDLEEYFGDLVDHMRKARDFADEDAEIVANLSETADMLANSRINEVMRILTVISVIMLPLTLITSFYGMNIDLPLQSSSTAFTVITSSMAMITIFLLFYFRWRGWL